MIVNLKLGLRQFIKINLFLGILSLIASPGLTQPHIELIVKNRIDHISSLAREPMVCQHPNGELFVTGYKNGSDSPQLWRSADMGKNWGAVNVGSPEDGAIGNSDVDLFIDEKGNIYLLSMTYTKLPENLEGFDFSTMKGERITLGVSRNEGKSWIWKTISEGDYDDRPWITSSSDGTLHIIWNDGKGVHHRASTDEGETWQKREDISAKGGSSFIANGFNGQLAVRVAPLSASGFKMDDDIDLIKMSLDNGRSWTDVQLPGNRTWTQDLSEIPRWVEPLIWDKENQLHALWSEGQQLKLGMTNDYGKSWIEHTVIQSADTTYFPYMEISDYGIICTWVSGFKQNIRHHAAVITVEGGVFNTYELEPQKLDVWTRFAVGEYVRATGGEYFPIIQLSNGNLGMVTTLQNSKANRLGFTWWELVLNRF